MDITKIKGALFDLDGVLIDSETLYTEFWKETGRRYGRSEPDFAYIIKGTTLNDILSTYFTPEQYEPLVKEIHDFENTMVYPVFPYVREFLEKLDSLGIRKAIVTSSDDTKMGYLFGQQPWFRDAFHVIVTGSRVKKSKPDPEGYNLAAKELDLAPEDCCVFEDSFQGLEAGRRAGGKVVALATTNPAHALEGLADMVIADFSELL